MRREVAGDAPFGTKPATWALRAWTILPLVKRDARRMRAAAPQRRLPRAGENTHGYRHTQRPAADARRSLRGDCGRPAAVHPERRRVSGVAARAAAAARAGRGARDDPHGAAG